MSRWATGWVVPGLLCLAALLLYFRRLDTPPAYVQDEVYHAYTAGQYVAGNPDAYLWNTVPTRKGVAYTWNHPPAGLLLIALGIDLWGDTSFGWRFASAVFGAVGLMMVYVLALALTRDPGIAQLSSALVLLDGLYFVQSRTAMLDIFGTVFVLCALTGFHRYLGAPPARARSALIWTGLFLGLAIATKWNAAYAACGIGVVALTRAASAWRGGNREAFRGACADIGIGLIAVPALVYLVAYIPFFLAGHGPGEFVELQKQIYLYHVHLRDQHGYGSSWWSWPLVIRPVWYHVTYAPGTVANIYALPNPLLYWAFLPAVLWLAWSWRRSNRAGLVVLLIGFFGQWLPWALVSRVAFIYHFLPAAVFGAIAVAAAIASLWAGGAGRRLLAVGYVAAVAAAFVFFHPVWSAEPLTPEAFASRIWLPTWK